MLIEISRCFSILVIKTLFFQYLLYIFEFSSSRCIKQCIENEKKSARILCFPSLSLDGAYVAVHPVNVFIHFALVENISDKPKTTGHDQSFVPFSNIVLEILSRVCPRLVTIILKGMKNYF